MTLTHSLFEFDPLFYSALIPTSYSLDTRVVGVTFHKHDFHNLSRRTNFCEM